MDKTVLDRINDEGRRRKRTVKFTDSLSPADATLPAAPEEGA